MSDQDVHDATGFGTDAILGFRRQQAGRTPRRRAICPEHMMGTAREREFERGAEVAREWMAMRRGVGTGRRSVRAVELRETGATTTMRACGAADLRAEQVGALREVARSRERARARVAEGEAATGAKG